MPPDFCLQIRTICDLRWVELVNITGPVASDSPMVAPKAKAAGCVSSCLAAISMAGLMAMTAAGAAFEFAQPVHSASASSADGVCQFQWWRSAQGGARYRILCDAHRPMALSKFKLLSGPRGVALVESIEDWGQRPWEDQRPMAGEEIVVEPGRTWRYDGTISLGKVPYVGPAVVDNQPLTWVADE